MAEKRMFTKKITDADEFVFLPSSTQALYLHLCMGADDDGFNNQVQMAMFKAHASLDDVKILLAKRFILQFESGVIVIKHWRMANALRKDRYTETAYQEELKRLKIKDNGSYTLANGEEEVWLPDGCQTVAKRLPQYSVDKDIIDNSSMDTTIIAQSQKAQSQKQAKNDEQKADVSAIPLNDGTEWLPEQSLFDEYVKLYPNVNVKQQFNAMRGWCMSNPTKRKTAKGIRRFVNTWLSKEQDKGGSFTKGNVTNEESERQRQEYKDYTDKLNKLRGM